MSEIYVVVADNDQPLRFNSGQPIIDENGPLVFEQYTRFADLENIKHRAAVLSARYGRCRIAKLQFVNMDGEPINLTEGAGEAW